MVTRTIKYTDFNGIEKEKKLYFNLTQTELTKLELSTNGGLKNTVQEIINSENNQKIYELFEKIVHASYGIKSEDGERFIKNPTVLEEFIQSAVYDEFMVYLFDAKISSDFVAELIRGALKNQKGVDIDKALDTAKVEAAKQISIVESSKPDNV